MLILTRKKDESLIIDGKIEIKIVELSEGRVKIGVEAPKDIEIHRKEIFEKIQEENKIALESKSKYNELASKLKNDNK